MKTIKKTLLHYQNGTSNKVYNVYLIEVSRGKYLVNFEYGRFGATLREGSKTSTPLDLNSAQKLYDSLVVSKMNKAYVIKEGYDSTKQEEKKEATILTTQAYKKLLLERLKKAGTVENKKLKKVDNYEVSRLIYRAGELKIEEAKDLIVALYLQNTKEENAFYYSVVWALGQYQDRSLRPILESLREKLNAASKYIVEEALFLLNDEKEAKDIQALTFPLPYAISLEAQNRESFHIQVKLLSEMIEEIYGRYKDLDSWDREKKAKVKNELMPLLSQADELYLKLYIWSSIDKKRYEDFLSILYLLPITELNFSLFRRLYKVAEFRNDQLVLGELVTKIESKKMGCYKSYNYHENRYKASIGCSKQYFKKRSFRYVQELDAHHEEAYIVFAKSVLLSLNNYLNGFKSFELGSYDNNWNWKVKKYDAFATHLTFMYIVYGDGQRYMLEPNKKMWEVANKSIKNENRPERRKELWNRHIDDVVEILAESRVLEVQTFAFNILKENTEALNSISIELLLKMMNLELKEARIFFFNVLKEKYFQTKDERIVKAFLFSNDTEIISFAIDEINLNPQLLLMEGLILEVIEKCGDKTIDKIVPILANIENPRVIVEEIFHKLITDSLPFNEVESHRMFTLLTHLTKEIRSEDILKLMEEKELNERHLFASKIIRLKALSHLNFPLELKEKIANYEHPEMLATTIYLLGTLSSKELMAEYKMLITFLYHTEKSVHKEARKILETLAKDESDGKVLLQFIVEKSFSSASDAVAENVEKIVKALKGSYGVIDPDQLYRMLIAKSKLAVRLGGLILSKYDAKVFSVVQWARLAKNPNKKVRVWAYDAYMNNEEMVKNAMPKSLMIFDTHWEDTRTFASGYFESFEMTTDDIVVIADSNHADVQYFAKKMIDKGDFDLEILLTKLSQHPALTIQKFVTDLMLADIGVAQILKMERFFNTLLHSVNQNRVAKTRVLNILNNFLSDKEVAQMYARLASHHSASMVWADKSAYVEAMANIAEQYPDIELPLQRQELETKEVSHGV